MRKLIVVTLLGGLSFLVSNKAQGATLTNAPEVPFASTSAVSLLNQTFSYNDHWDVYNSQFQYKNSTLGQSFTAPSFSNQLTSFSLDLGFRDNDLLNGEIAVGLEIYTTAGALVAKSLNTPTLTPGLANISSNFQTTTFDFASVNLVSGNEYLAIVNYQDSLSEIIQDNYDPTNLVPQGLASPSETQVLTTAFQLRARNGVDYAGGSQLGYASALSDNRSQKQDSYGNLDLEADLTTFLSNIPIDYGTEIEDGNVTFDSSDLAFRTTFEAGGGNDGNQTVPEPTLLLGFLSLGLLRFRKRRTH